MEKLESLIIEKYIYTTEEEKCIHKKQMKENGFSNNGQIYINLGTLYEPDYHLYGCYSKYL